MFFETPAQSIDFKNELNPQQYAVSSAPLGPSVVLSGAGSGKTRTLVYRVAWLLQKEKATPKDILLLTFTNKSAKEMLQRVEQLTGHASGEFSGGTFHSVAGKYLRQLGACIDLDPNFTIIDEDDAKSLLKKAIQKEDPHFFKEKSHPRLPIIRSIISYSRNTQQSIETTIDDTYPYLSECTPDIQQFAQLYQERKRHENLCDYDDLLVFWLQLLTDSPTAKTYLQKTTQHILIDEYQDINALQGNIITLMGELHKNVMIVGDNWQCIYTWRGASFSNIKDFATTFHPVHYYKVEYNYRSSPEILKVANNVMKGHPKIEGYPLKLKAQQPSHSKPHVIECLDGRRQADTIINCIEQLKSQHYASDDIAILYRAHFHALELQFQLSRLGIPYIITSGVKFYEQAHIRDLIAQLRFINNASDSTAFDRFTGHLPGIGIKTSERILRTLHTTAQQHQIDPRHCLLHPDTLKKIPPKATDAYTAMAHTLQDAYHQYAQTPPAIPQQLIQILIKGWYGDTLKTLYDHFQSRKDDLEAFASFSSGFNSLEKLLTELALLESEPTNNPLHPDEDSIRLSTIHQAKGLEFPAVIVIGLTQELFPTKRSLEDGTLDEEQRLFYVALTRAKEKLILTYPRLIQSGGPPRIGQPSSFLSHLNEDTYEHTPL